MVARGDLGIEVSPEGVPMMQKMIIQLSNQAGKPVITATQMLDSMIRNPRPTRAEASDVANAILDGTDAIMLSGETAVGKYPIEAVETMVRIAAETEPYARFGPPNLGDAKHSISEAVCYAATDTANMLRASAIIAPTMSGGTARILSRFRSLESHHRHDAQPDGTAPVGVVLGRPSAAQPAGARYRHRDRGGGQDRLPTPVWCMKGRRWSSRAGSGGHMVGTTDSDQSAMSWPEPCHGNRVWAATQSWDGCAGWRRRWARMWCSTTTKSSSPRRRIASFVPGLEHAAGLITAEGGLELPRLSAGGRAGPARQSWALTTSTRCRRGTGSCWMPQMAWRSSATACGQGHCSSG